MRKYPTKNVEKIIVVAEAINRCIDKYGKLVRIEHLEKEAKMSRVTLMGYVRILMLSAWLFIPRKGYVKRI